MSLRVAPEQTIERTPGVGHVARRRRVVVIAASAGGVQALIPLFETAGATLGTDVVGVVLTGGDGDATDGVQTIRRHGGIVSAQDRATSQCFSMPEAAIASGAVDQVVPLGAIGALLVTIARGARSAPTNATGPETGGWT